MSAPSNMFDPSFTSSDKGGKTKPQRTPPLTWVFFGVKINQTTIMNSIINLVHQKDFKNARKNIDKHLSKNPSNIDYLHLKGVILSMNGEIRRCLRGLF